MNYDNNVCFIRLMYIVLLKSKAKSEFFQYLSVSLVLYHEVASVLDVMDPIAELKTMALLRVGIGIGNDEIKWDVDMTVNVMEFLKG